MDLYQRLGIKRGASEAEIKKAYRSLAKQLHPDRNKDNPKAAERFAEVTQAYDLLSDKDKRARYDRGEIDEDGNPQMPFGGRLRRRFGGGGGPRPGGRRVRRLSRRVRRAATRPISATCSKACSARAGAAAARAAAASAVSASAPAAAEGRRRRLPAQGAVRRRRDAEAAAGHAGRRQDDRPQAAQGRRGRHQDPPCRARARKGPAGRGDAIVTIEIAPHPFFTRDGNNIRLTCR